MKDPFPLDAEDLVEWLTENYPPRCIKPNEDLTTAHRYAGQRELVEKLMHWRDREDRSRVQHQTAEA